MKFPLKKRFIGLERGHIDTFKAYNHMAEQPKNRPTCQQSRSIPILSYNSEVVWIIAKLSVWRDNSGLGRIRVTNEATSVADDAVAVQCNYSGV